MATKYFNKWEFHQVATVAETNLLLAAEMYEEYLESYPKDYYAYTYYAETLTTLRRFDEAEKILNQVEIYYKKNGHFLNNAYRVGKLKESIIYTRLKLLAYQEKYEELYKFYSEHYLEIKNSEMNMNSLEFYCKKKLGMLNCDENKPNSYLLRQIMEYKEEDFLDHLKKHLAQHNEKAEVPNETIFQANFPIFKILEEIKKYMPSDKKICPGFLEDVYIFRYDECGRCNHKLVDYFKVICFHNTTDIITMYPAPDGKDLPHVELNYIKQKDEKPKVKRISQIEKFNQRYKIN